MYNKTLNLYHMKKYIYVLLLLVVFKAKAQDAVVFKMKYLPGHNYNSGITMNIDCKISLAGDQKVIDQMASQGMTQPIALNMKISMGGVTKTGSSGKNGVFPLTMNYKMDSLKLNLGGKAIPIPATINADVLVYGHAGRDGKLIADSLGGGKAKDTSQKKMTQMMNAFQNMVKFPDRPLHVGDTFVQDMPFNIPVAGNSMDANSKATYKLVSIDNGMAYFDVIQNMDLNIPIKTERMNLSGSGTGKLVYDIKNSFPADYKVNITLKFSGKIATLQIDGIAMMDMDYKNVVN